MKSTVRLMEKKKRGFLFWLSGAVPVPFAAASLIAIINSNLLYAHLGRYSYIALLAFPLLTLGSAVFHCIMFYRKKDVFSLVFVLISVVAVIAPLILSTGASISKIQGDFLKHETAFNSEAARLSASGNGIKEIGLQELNFAVPLKKAEVFNAGTGRSVVFFYTFESASRIEGYVYIEKEHYPIAWDINYTEWSTPLDINKQWFYICTYPSN